MAAGARAPRKTAMRIGTVIRVRIGLRAHAYTQTQKEIDPGGGVVVRFQADGCVESVRSCADKTQGQLQKTRPNQRVFARSSCAATFRKGVVPFLLYRRSCCPGSQGRGVGHPSGCGCLRGGARRGSPTMVGCSVCSPRYLSRHGVFTRRIPFRTGLGIRC